jgi:hypothetical protein
MKGIFWNCNGLGDTKKFKFLSDLNLEKGLDFIALSETRRREYRLLSQKSLICCGR